MSDRALEFLRERAGKSRDTAGLQLARSRNAEKQVEDQIGVLLEYRSMYRRKMQQAMLEGTSLQKVRDYQTFLASLDTAIESARSSQAQHQQEVERSAQAMNRHHREYSSFDTIMNRRRDTQALAELRRDAKEQDALAARIHSNARGSDAGNHFLGTENTHE